MIDRTVVPRALHNLEVLARQVFRASSRWSPARPPAEWRHRRSMSTIRASLGADRAVNAIAAHAKHAGDLIVVDFGTATTFDVDRLQRRLQGRDHRARASTSRSTRWSATPPSCRASPSRRRNRNSVIGRNTEDQMQIGVFWGYVAMIEGLIARMRAEIGRPAKVVATGGLAVLFDEHDRHLRRGRPRPDPRGPGDARRTGSSPVNQRT